MPSFESTLALPTPGQPFSLPLAQPDPASKPTPPQELTASQQSALDALINHFNEPDFSLPVNHNQLKTLWRQKSGSSGRSFFGFGSAPVDETPVLEPLTDVEKCYWSREAFLRCLRACRWDQAAALKRAEETLVWRREANVEGMGPEAVSIEGETGKELVFGYDVAARPVLYMHPYRQNTATGPRQIDFVIWCLERTIDLCPPGTEMLCLCIDFGANLKNNKAQPTSIGQARKVLHILQTYYCERLGRAVCANVPAYFWPFYKLVGPFVDPVTKDKIRFLDGAAHSTDLVPAQQLQKIFGGDVDLVYDHETYFPALHNLCMERKAANLARWKQHGNNQCGLSEFVIRGGSDNVNATEQTIKEEMLKSQNGATEAEAKALEEKVPVELQESNGDAVKGEEKEVQPEEAQEPISTPTLATQAQNGDAEKFVEAPVASEETVKVAQAAA